MARTTIAAVLRTLGMLAMVAGLGTAAQAAPPAVPEIDPGSMMSALTLLSGGLLMLSGRRVRK